MSKYNTLIYYQNQERQCEKMINNDYNHLFDISFYTNFRLGNNFLKYKSMVERSNKRMKHEKPIYYQNYISVDSPKKRTKYSEKSDDFTKIKNSFKQKNQIFNSDQKTDSLRPNIIKLISEETYKSMSEKYNNIHELEKSPISECLEIVNEFIENYQSIIINYLKNDKLLDDFLKVSLNCLYVSINIISKYIEIHQLSTTINDSSLIRVFDGFFDMISLHNLAERICESILYAMCSLMKLENKEINNEFWKKKLEICFQNDKISEENKLASSIILVQLDIFNSKLISKIEKYLDKIDFDVSENYFGFTQSEIIYARNKISDLTEANDQISVIETKTYFNELRNNNQCIISTENKSLKMGK